jgi:hypothetical protein
MRQYFFHLAKGFLRATSIKDLKHLALTLINIHVLVGFGLECAPVRCAHPSFWGSLPRQTGRCAPPRPSQLRCLLFDPQKYLQSIKLGPPTSRAFFFPLHGLQRLCNMRSPAPLPAHILTVCCITDMHINDIHISVILRGFWEGQAFFDPFRVKITVYEYLFTSFL